MIREVVDPSSRDIEYVLLVLHPGDSTWNPNPHQPLQAATITNDTTGVKVFRLAAGMGYWIGPTEIEPDTVEVGDAKTLCRCGVGVHVRPEETP